MPDTFTEEWFTEPQSLTMEMTAPPKYLAPITGGSIEISESGDNYHIKLTDCVTNTGYKVIFDYEGPISPFNDGRTPTTEGSAASVIATAGNAAAMTAPWTPGE